MINRILSSLFATLYRRCTLKDDISYLLPT